MTLAGVTWHLRQPTGEQPGPVVGTDQRGILWVRFPPLLTGHIRPHPSGDYTILYTPLRPEGGDLAQGAQTLLTLPGNVNGNDQHVTTLEAVDAGHFLLRTYTGFPDAMTGGREDLWWLDPATRSARLLLTGAGTGGSYLTATHNQRWLFWNQGRGNVPTFDPLVKDAAAFVVDLRTGEKRQVHLGGYDWASEPKWGPDGRLHFKLEGKPGEFSLDPASGQVAPGTGGQ